MSAKLAISARQLTIRPREAYDAILTGYMEGLKIKGQPFVLSERHQWLQEMTTSSLRDPVQFWNKMQALSPVKGSIPSAQRRL